MPLVRAVVRNEYGLGLPELYKEANREDPKAVLDGVAVAGLVGILRQLGDLAEFAAEVFHDVQEQVMTTASRSRKLMIRVHNIEAAFPPLEKAILAQKSHLHFSYTAGSECHPQIHTGENHFIYDDLPRFIMDSYEECSDPPRLHLLDKFDTGGPGSCLKRYSDPTYFRRTSSHSHETNLAEVSRDKELSKSKKKRSRLRKGEVSRGMSLSNNSGRMHFSSQNIDEQTSPSQTVSTSNATQQYDQRDQSNSCDSRTGSGYIECVLNPSYSSNPDEFEPKDFSSPRSETMPNNTLDPDFVDQQNEDENDYDYSSHSLSQEKSGPNPSSVRWDEKTEILESTGRHYDHVENTETLPADLALDTRETEVKFTTTDNMDLEFENENIATVIPDLHQTEENESEPDSFEDALNTIESESETDLECETKREVRLYNSFNNAAENGIHCPKEHHSDHDSTNRDSTNLDSTNLDSHTPVCGLSNKASSLDNTYSIVSELYDHELISEMDGESSNPNSAANVGSVAAKESHSASEEQIFQAPVNDEIISSSNDSQNSYSEFSGFRSVNIWTNGGLLGLEPSKPPDFSSLNSQNTVTTSGDDRNSASGQGNGIKGDASTGKRDLSTLKDHECSTSSHDGKEDGTPFKKASFGFPPANYVTKLEKSSDSYHTDVKASCTEISDEDGEKSKHMFGFSNRLLVNGFQSNESSVRNGNYELESFLRSGGFQKKSMDQSAFEAFPETPFNEYGGRGLIINSPSSSPPLQHLKISFHPVNSFETSKLALKFPDRGPCHESGNDMFPSFQLVPELVTPFPDNGSDSGDDDTFCRSSPYMSDDCLSQNSESNSEQWESGETLESNDHELYGALRRMSLSESVSSSHREPQSPFAENCMEPSQCGRIRNLPSLDILNPLYELETKTDLERNDFHESHSPEEPTPVPPPLPPLEWRVMKSHLDVEDNQDGVSEGFPDYLNDVNHGSTILMQSNSTAAHQQQNIEISPLIQRSQPDEKKLNEQKEAKQAINNKGVDDKEDFLQQIRTKSFNLRRISSAGPARNTSNPTVNTKVTAILEKAIAIRQVVGSDDGEDDDTWSDT